MNYIFLDIDGVLNCQKDIVKKIKRHAPSIERHFNEKAYKRLGQICSENNAQIILSSTWRLGFCGTKPIHELSQRFVELCDKYGIKMVGLLSTPIDNRGKLILRYMKENFTAEDKYIVIDDENVDCIPSIQFIKTDYKTGLLNSHIREARKAFRCQ